MQRILFVMLCICCYTIVNYGQWTELNTGINADLYSISAVNDKVVWASGASGVILLTTDGGNTWLNRGGGTVISTTNLYNIFGIDSMKALATGSGAAGNIYKTTDGGMTWTQVFTQTGGFGDAIWMIDSTRGVFYGDPVGGKWSIWLTSNGGTTWDSAGVTAPAPPTGAAGWNNSIFADSTNIYIGTGGTQILHSTDFGKTWQFITSTGQVNSFAIYFSNSTTGLVGGSQLIRTTNGGAAWTPVNSLGAGNISGLGGTKDTVWMIRQGTSSSAPDTGVYRSTDAGLTWTQPYFSAVGGTNNHLSVARNGNSVWIAKSNGNIIRYLSTATAVNDQEITPGTYYLGQNYPNPFNPSTTIKYQVQSPGFISLKVYDVLGREVATLVNENKATGIYTVNFNAANYPSGVYIYRLNAGTFTDVKKMTLIK